MDAVESRGDVGECFLTGFPPGGFDVATTTSASGGGATPGTGASATSGVSDRHANRNIITSGAD
ncbi:MAG: hypothetical protein LBM94_04340 [Propionibacteriaceae bacterium]|nr:hypothetical protein [Propionibacteriaceae bacterium]